MKLRPLVLVVLLVLAPFTPARAAEPEGDLYLLGVALDQKGIRGGWARVGAEGAWKAVRAGAIFKDRLYTAEKDGTLQMANLDSGLRTPIGKPDFGDTTFLFAGEDNLYSIESNGNLFRVNPGDGVWTQIGAGGAWKAVRAGAILKGRLYTAENDGTLRATNLADGTRKQIGKADFGTTVSMFAVGDNLWTIETDGNLFRVDPANGVWVPVGPEAAWKALRGGAVLKDQLYTAESDGTLRAAKLADGKRQRIGPAEFGNTQWMFAASNAIYTIETDGNLFVVTVRPPESIDAFDCFPKEFEKVFREQGRDYYRNFDGQLILGKKATLAGIRDGLAWLRKKATKKDLVVMYLTCHGGINAEEGWGVETADGQTLWGHEIKAELAKLPCHALVFIETCASGGFARPHKKGPPVPANVTAFCACSGKQSIDNQLDIAALEGLWGRADFNRDGVVELDELLRYVEERYKELLPPAKKAADSVRPIIVKSKTAPGSLPLTKTSRQLGAVVHDGRMWSALVDKQDGANYAVHLLGWNNTPGKPYFLTGKVTRDCICLPSEGPPLMVEQNGTWFPARLLSRVGEKYKVHYLGYNEEEVVTKSRIKYPFVGKP